MLDKYSELAPAKVNLFLKILNKRQDNYYNIRSGVTFVNLFDEIKLEQSSSFKISYKGKFSPQKNYKDCIIERLFKIFSIKKPNYNFIIKKNIPIQSGLGSASSNAAAVFRILEKLKIYKVKSHEDLVILGSDVPSFFYQKDCLIQGKGDKISNLSFPKFYFLLVKPALNCDTKKMYDLVNNRDTNKNVLKDVELSNSLNYGNDFEKILNRNEPDISKVLDFLRGLEKNIISNLTGSGSCCYAAFKEQKFATQARYKFKKIFPKLWCCLVENNFR